MMVSLVFALILFLTATSSSYNNTKSRTESVLETYSHTVEDVPIDIKYDSDTYFISGYSYESEVYLTSTNRVKLDSEINSDTRQFKVVADLTRLEEGSSKVPLQIINLPEEVSATVKPVNMSVTIGKKTTKKIPVELELTDDDFASGFELKGYEFDLSEVSVTSDEASIEQISHVVARLPEGVMLSDDYDGEVTLQAITSSGLILPTVIEPAKANLKVSVAQLRKEVPVRVEYTGKLDSSLSDIKYDLSQKTVSIYGAEESLSEVNELVVKVDISGIKEDVNQTVLLLHDKVTVSPGNMAIKLTVIKK